MNAITYSLLIIALLNVTLQAKPKEIIFSDLKFPQNEQITFQMKNKGELVEVLNTIKKIEENNAEIYQLESFCGTTKTTTKFNAADFSPIIYHKQDSAGNTIMKVDYSETYAHITIPDKKVDSKIKLKPNTFDKSTFIYLFRMMPFEQMKGKVKFNFIVDARSWGYQLVEMYIKVNGEDNIQTPAGEIPCYEVELGATGIIGAFFMKDKFYYYFSKEAPHYFVKYLDPDGNDQELVKYNVPE